MGEKSENSQQKEKQFIQIKRSIKVTVALFVARILCYENQNRICSVRAWITDVVTQCSFSHLKQSIRPFSLNRTHTHAGHVPPLRISPNDFCCINLNLFNLNPCIIHIIQLDLWAHNLRLWRAAYEIERMLSACGVYTFPSGGCSSLVKRRWESCRSSVYMGRFKRTHCMHEL